MPILLAIKAWSIWSRLGGLLSSAAGWASRNPRDALIIVLLIGNVVQLVIHKRDLAQLAKIVAVQKQAVAIQKKDDAGAVAAVVTLNGVTDHDYEDGLADGKAQLSAYVAAHGSSLDGMRAGDPPASAGAPAEDHAAPVPAEPGAAAAAVAFTQDQLSVWDTTWQDDHDCRIWAGHIASMFDGKHWPTSGEVAATQSTPGE